MLLERLVRPQEMIAGSLYETYRTCGKPSCRCARGEMHGPFMALSTREQGRRSVKHIRHGDEDWVKKRAVEYREYQKALAKLRKTNMEILAALKDLRDGCVKIYS